MSENNSNKKNQIFIIWGLFISAVVMVLLILLLLFLQPKVTPSTSDESPIKLQTLKPPSQEQDEIYQRIINKIETEIDKLTPQTESSKSNLKYPNKIITLPDGFLEITEFNQATGKKIKETKLEKTTNKRTKVIVFDENEKYSIIYEYDLKKGLLKQTSYNPDGTVKETKTY